MPRHKKLMASKQRSKGYNDKTVRRLTFNVGDKALIKNESRKHKLSQIWLGPYQVIAIQSDVNTTIKIGKRTVTVHNNGLKTYFE